MSTQPLLPDPTRLTLDGICIRGAVIAFETRTTGDTASCPACGCACDRVHSHYRRTLADLPWQGNTVQIHLAVRKFFCDNLGYSRRIFTEPVPTVARRYARKTTRLEGALQELTWLVGGEAAARIARGFGLLVSPDALLYRLKQADSTAPSTTTPQVIGIDDFALRRGQRYGTIVIDLQTSTPIDLLADRETVTVEKWLQQHPGIKIVSRDRSSSYADAIRQGAPDARQVADRFHLHKNLMEALQQQVAKESKTIRQILVPQTPSQEDEGPVKLSRRQERARQESRQRRFERWQKTHELFGQGYAKKEIARMLNRDIHTVRTYLLASTFPSGSAILP
jgi:transposase